MSTIFFPRTSLQLCIVCHGTNCDRWKIVELNSLHFYCFHAILISVSVARHDLKIHKKIRQNCGFSLKNILVDVSLSKSELISFFQKGNDLRPNSVLEITLPLFESFIFTRLKKFFQKFREMIEIYKKYLEFIYGQFWILYVLICWNELCNSFLDRLFSVNFDKKFCKQTFGVCLILGRSLVWF